MSNDTTRPAAACPELRYTKLPDALLSALSPREHQLVHLLLSYRWTPTSPIYPFVGTMATRLGWSGRTVQRTLRSLEAKGYLVTTPDFRETDKGQTANRYAPGPLLLPLLSSVDAEPGTRAEQPGHPPVTAQAGKKREQNQRPSKERSQPEYRPKAEADASGDTRSASRCWVCPGRHPLDACPEFPRRR